MSKSKIYCLCGECATGKTTLELIVKGADLNRVISYTTRPARSNEKDGIDYRFVNDVEFEKLEKNEGFYEQTSYIVDGKRLRYALAPSSIRDDIDNVVVVNPHGLEQLKKSKELSDRLVVVKLNSSLYLRIQRYVERETSEEKYRKLVQRLAQDDKDFSDFRYDELIVNEGTVEEMVQSFKKIREKYIGGTKNED